MKSIAISSKNLAQVFTQLQAQLGGNLMENRNEFIVTINNFLATGSIKGIEIDNAIALLEFNLTTNESLEFFHKIDNAIPIQFIYGCEGEIKYGFEQSIFEGTIDQFQTGIFTNPLERSIFFKCEKNQHIRMSIITVETSSINDDVLKHELQQNFVKNNHNQASVYLTSLNVKIAEKINELNQIKHKDLVRGLLQRSIIYAILALQIEQYKLDKITINTPDSLTKNDLQTIYDMARFIRTYPEKEYNLKLLSAKTALSPIKLQKGFKLIYNRTVADFIKNCRIEVAEDLLRNTELNISEIVYSIGLTSRSYFSKIFKEKYKCSPKEYKNKQKPTLIVA